MCGRYTIISKAEEVSEQLGVECAPIQPQYNATPSYKLPVISSLSPNQVSFYRWGLIPSWAKDAKIGNHTINARSESITEKASFKQPIKSQRCLVLANCYFEWKKEASGSKQPFVIHHSQSRLFLMAGIWANWIEPQSKESIFSFSIITVPANSKLRHIHDRMPVYLTPKIAKQYITNQNLDQVITLLQTAPNETFNYYPVSGLVNSPANNAREILKPLK